MTDRNIKNEIRENAGSRDRLLELVQRYWDDGVHIRYIGMINKMLYDLRMKNANR